MATPHKALRRQSAPFDPALLDKAVIAIPLLRELETAQLMAELAAKQKAPRGKGVVAIELNAKYADGLDAAREAVERKAKNVRDIDGALSRQQRNTPPELRADQSRWVLATLTVAETRKLHAWNAEIGDRRLRPIQQILPKYPGIYPVVIDINLEYPQGRDEARRWVLERLKSLVQAGHAPGERSSSSKNDETSQYVFAALSAASILQLVESSADPQKNERPIYRIWPDFDVQGLIVKSVATVKSDAAFKSFAATGDGITWAVVDSGIDRNHPHFTNAKTFEGISEKFHRDFTDSSESERPFEDGNGHGTHVAGIIAGGQEAPKGGFAVVSRFFKPNGDTGYDCKMVESDFRGIAPKCKLINLKVLDEYGEGSVSNVIAALSYIQKLNGHGRRLLVHGVNLSLGYTFEPEWFACGQSPLCVEVDRLVKSGVVVVVAAGNTGYGTVKSEALGSTPAGLDITINDPGNANLAITVGSTHRDMPHTYGVSYFSSKGPTGDGRLKPDLVAPGEKILSCAAGKLKKDSVDALGKETACDYVENSGTSMAAPHVSGAIAAFLSIRREFIGEPEKVKEVFMAAAMDLKRERYFQGSGLVDLMRAIQSV